MGPGPTRIASRLHPPVRLGGGGGYSLLPPGGPDNVLSELRRNACVAEQQEASGRAVDPPERSGNHGVPCRTQILRGSPKGSVVPVRVFEIKPVPSCPSDPDNELSGLPVGDWPLGDTLRRFLRLSGEGVYPFFPAF